MLVDSFQFPSLGTMSPVDLEELRGGLWRAFGFKNLQFHLPEAKLGFHAAPLLLPFARHLAKPVTRPVQHAIFQCSRLALVSKTLYELILVNAVMCGGARARAPRNYSDKGCRPRRVTSCSRRCTRQGCSRFYCRCASSHECNVVLSTTSMSTYECSGVVHWIQLSSNRCLS